MSAQDVTVGGHDGSWLCPSAVDRARMLELDERLGATGNVVQPLLPLSLVVSAWWVGPWSLLPLLAVPLFVAMPRLLHRMRRPEFLFTGTLLLLTVTLAVAIGRTGGLHSPLIVWPLFQVLGVTTRYNRRSAMLMTAVIAASDISAVVAADPARLRAGLAALLCLVVVAVAIGHYGGVLAGAELDHREAALLDPLTGLLNRSSLESRFAELREQACQNGRPVGLVLCDLDHFKQVNDVAGHDRGDAVLRDTAYELRKATRSFELIYRIGGEEFLVVLPDVGVEEAREVAETLRKAVVTARPGGLDLTASFGVSCACGPDIDFARLFQAADQALYEAKAAGRNAVRVGVPRSCAARQDASSSTSMRAGA